MLEIRIEKTTKPKQKPENSAKLPFGSIFTDHMFVMNYDEGKGWHDARIIPYQNLSLEPSAMVFHYGQEMFEGLKAYKTDDGRTLLFRPQKNIERANNSNARLCIPQIPPEIFLDALKAVVKMDEDWIPTAEGTSLYIRPFVIATEPHLGVKASPPISSSSFFHQAAHIMPTVLILSKSGLKTITSVQFAAVSANQKLAATT